MDRRTLEKEIADVLELPYRHRKGKAHTIVNAVLKAIAVGLEQDGRVRIDGFGIFTVRTRRAWRCSCYYAPYRGGSRHMTKGGVSEVQTVPDKKYVHFQPSTSITKVLNG